MDLDQDTVGALTAVIAVATLPLGILAFLFGSVTAAAVVFVVGWFLLTPLVPILGELLVDDEPAAEPERDPLEEVRERYARGDIDEVEFERRVERLVGTEDLEYDPAAGSGGPLGADAPEDEERHREYEREVE